MLNFEKKWVCERNSTPNYFSVKKFQMRRLDLKTKKLFFVTFEFQILIRRGTTKF